MSSIILNPSLKITCNKCGWSGSRNKSKVKNQPVNSNMYIYYSCPDCDNLIDSDVDVLKEKIVAQVQQGSTSSTKTKIKKKKNEKKA